MTCPGYSVICLSISVLVMHLTKDMRLHKRKSKMYWKEACVLDACSIPHSLHCINIYLWKAVGGEDVEEKEKKTWTRRRVREREKGGGVGTWWWFDQQISLSLSFIRSRAERGSRLYRGINTVWSGLVRPANLKNPLLFRGVLLGV